MPTPEEMARQIIDQRLVQAGWLVQDKAQMNLGAGLGVAVREYPLPAAPCDYLLFVDRKAAGVIEAKPEGRTLTGVTDRTNQHFTLKQSPLARLHLDDFAACFRGGERHARTETERFRPFTYDELSKRDRLNLDLFWLKDDSLEDTSTCRRPTSSLRRSSITWRRP